jgi:hypothetical protein
MLLGKLIQEYLLDGGMIRFALVALTPFLFCITMFAAMCVVGSVVRQRMTGLRSPSNKTLVPDNWPSQPGFAEVHVLQRRTAQAYDWRAEPRYCPTARVQGAAGRSVKNLTNHL